MISVIVNDYVVSRRAKLFFFTEDYELVERRWNETDPVLDGLQSIDFFSGRTRWCDLTGAHFRIMIAKHLQLVGEFAEDDRLDDENPIVASLNFLICCLVRFLETASDCHIESMKINRVAALDLAIDFTATMRMEAQVERPRPDGLSLVVDNTQDN